MIHSPVRQSTLHPLPTNDELVFHFCKPGVRERLSRVSGIAIGQLSHLSQAIGDRFANFVRNGAKAAPYPCHPPSRHSRFRMHWLASRSSTYSSMVNRATHPTNYKSRTGYFGVSLNTAPSTTCLRSHDRGQSPGLSRRRLPRPRSIRQPPVAHSYAELFNRFPQVRFPISVLASVTNRSLPTTLGSFPM